MALKPAVTRNPWRIAVGAGLALALAGCSETMGPGPVANSAQAVANAIQPSGFSPRAATLAVTQSEGAPQPLQSQYMALFNADVAYLVTSNARDLRPETIATLAPLGWRVVETWDFTTVHVLKFEREG